MPARPSPKVIFRQQTSPAQRTYLSAEKITEGFHPWCGFESAFLAGLRREVHGSAARVDW